MVAALLVIVLLVLEARSGRWLLACHGLAVSSGAALVSDKVHGVEKVGCGLYGNEPVVVELEVAD